MAVAHSAASESHTGTTGSTSQASFNWTHTQTGTPRGVVVFVHTNGSTNLISSVTYGTVSLTAVTGGAAVDAAGEPCRTDVYFAGSGLPTGNQTITVNRTNNATTMYASAATVTAGADTAIPSATIVLLEGDGTLAEQNVNDTSPGQNSVRYAGITSGLNNVPAAGANSTALVSIDYGNTYTAALVRETTAGQGSRAVGFSSGTTDDRAAVHLAIRELVPRTETPIVGTFTLTGGAPDLTKFSPKVMDGGTGAFTLTGNAADLRHNPKLDAGTGAFALAGQPADARHNVRIDGGTGAFSLTGNPATLAKVSGKTLAVDVGTFALIGNDAALRRGYALGADAGAYLVLPAGPNIDDLAQDGNFDGLPYIDNEPAQLTVGRQLAAAAGAFTLAGEPAGFAVGRQLAAAAGSFTLTGQPASLAAGRRLPAVAGAFALTGNDATLKQDYALDAGTGAFTFTGNPATLIKAAADELTPIVGAFTLSGNAATLKRSWSLAGDRGAFTLTGQAAALTRSRLMTGARGQFLLSGNQASLIVARAMLGSRGAFIFTGNPAGLADTDRLAAEVGAFTFTGNAASLAKSSGARRRNVLIF